MIFLELFYTFFMIGAFTFGGGAQMALANAGIKLYGGVMGDADDAVEALLSGELNFNPCVRCSHHDHGSEHSCGDHGCGSHSCH